MLASRHLLACQLAFLMPVCVLLAGTAGAEVDCPPPPHRAFAHTSSSLSALGQEFLAALARRDVVRLRQMSISEHEFQKLYWPYNPNSRPPNSLPAEFAWGLYKPKYEHGLRRLLDKHGGKQYRLKAIGLGEEREASETFVIHLTSWIEVEDESGTTERLRLFGAVIEQCGRFKIYGFVTD